MVSYYNSFSMFPGASHASQPHMTAAAAAARHAQHSPAAMAAAQTSAYLHGYPGAAVSAAAYHHQAAFAQAAAGHAAAAASSAGQSAAAPASSGYSAASADLNSNMYTGASSASSPNSHQFQDAPHPANSHPATGTNWHAQSVWHPTPQFMAAHHGSAAARASLGPYPEWPLGGAPAPTSAPAQPTSSTSSSATPPINSSGTTEGTAPEAGSSSDGPPPSSGSPPPTLALMEGPNGSKQPPQESPRYSSGSPGGHTDATSPTPGYPSGLVGHPHQTPDSGIATHYGKGGFYGGPHSPPMPHGSHPHGAHSPGEVHGHTSGYDMDDGAGSDQERLCLSPPLSNRPQPARSPFEWMKKPSYQSQPDKSGRTRTKDKYRIVYSDHQRLELEKEFHYSRYITIRRKAELANSVGLSERQVKIWFQNRRAKERRALKKGDDTGKEGKVDPAAAAAAASSAAISAMSAAFSEGIPHYSVPPPPPMGNPHMIPTTSPGGHEGVGHAGIAHSAAMGDPSSAAAAAALVNGHYPTATPPFGMPMKFE